AASRQTQNGISATPATVMAIFLILMVDSSCSDQESTSVTARISIRARVGRARLHGLEQVWTETADAFAPSALVRDCGVTKQSVASLHSSRICCLTGRCPARREAPGENPFTYGRALCCGSGPDFA